MSEVVVDCSATMAWFFADEKTATAMGVLSLLSQDGAVVPAIWPVEVANVLLLGERRGRVVSGDAARFLAELSALPIAIESGNLGPNIDRCLTLARAHALTAYDALYLELAQRASLTLCTKDADLLRAAAAEGITTVDVSR